jgi:catalase
MVLNKNPDNYFAEVEQATFSPGSFVPGIEASPDKMLQGRLFAYGDAHRYRVGANHNTLPINRPIAEVNNNQRDGSMRADGNGSNNPSYYEPNSLGGATESAADKPAPFEVSGVADSVSYDHHDHYTQPGDLYRLMKEDERTRLVATIVGAMAPVESDEIKLRQIGHWYKADAELGSRIASGLGLSVPQ